MSSAALFRTEAEIDIGRSEWGGPITVDTSLGTVQVRISGDLQPLEAVWEELQAVSPCTGAQTFAWAQAWERHVLGPEGREPVIAVGTGADGQVLFLWPFEMRRRAGMRLLKWLGQEHANYNLGLFATGIAAALTGEDVSRLLRSVARRSGAVAAVLKAQPVTFDGIANPFAKLPHQPAPSNGYAVRLGDFTALYEQRFGKRSRKTLDRKERKLAEAGRLAYGWAETRDEQLRLIDIFFAQKALQFAAQGVRDMFDVHARAFYRELVLLEGDNPSRLRLGYVTLDDKVLATFCGTRGHDRLVIVLCSLAEGDHQRQSPGALLIKHQINEACAKGLALYDFGAGSGAHKEQWADVVEPLFDSFIAFKPHALSLTLLLAARSRLKRAIKTNRYVWPVAQKLRTRLFGRPVGA
jgi:CelD/BcsL family acetyltransferase involved in cellulose biosynthesis